MEGILPKFEQMNFDGLTDTQINDYLQQLDEYIKKDTNEMLQSGNTIDKSLGDLNLGN